MPRRRATTPLAERPIQRSNIHLLAMMRIHAVHIPNGSSLAGDKIARAKQSAAKKADGMRPDIIGGSMLVSGLPDGGQ